MKIEKYTFNGFTYIKNYDENNNDPIIEHNKEKPQHLFKFYSFSELNVKALLSGYFYASHPFQLNDTLDSNKYLLHTSKELDYEFYEKFFGEDVEKDKLIELYEKDINSYRKCNWYISTHYQVTTNLFGIISMTTTDYNILMWPHYTQEKGFQIKFNTEKLEQSIIAKLAEQGEYLGLYPINYCKKLSPIDIHLYDQMFLPLFYITNVKLDKWKYEDEWRFLVSKPNMGVPYSILGLDPREDYHVKTENRFVYYDNKLIEQITVASNFFNGKDFKIFHQNSIDKFVTPKNEEHKQFLDFIVENLKDRFYHTGIKYELDDEENTFIIRTKERLEIEKVGDSYKLSRTDDYIKYFD